MVLNPRLRFRLHGCTLLVHTQLMCEHVCSVHLLPSGLLAVRCAEIQIALMRAILGNLELHGLRLPPELPADLCMCSGCRFYLQVCLLCVVLRWLRCVTRRAAS